MSRKRRVTPEQTAWAVRGMGGADLALQYLAHVRGAEPAPPESPGVTPQRRAVVVNAAQLADAVVDAMERAWQMPIADGQYWYDPVCGAWGLEGGPCAGYMQAGLHIGGPLRADASRGNTGVVINGRVLHPIDVMALQRIGAAFPGRYWLDAHGNFGYEGGPALGNLVAAAGLAGGGAWSVPSRFGTVGGDGSGFMYFNDGSTSWST